MNLWGWIDLTKTIGESWKWLPKTRRRGWPTANGSVWYLEFDWLNFGLRADNER